MLFNYENIKQHYINNRSPYREAAKYFFSIVSGGLGAIWLWLNTIVVKDGELAVRENARGEMTLLPPGRHSNFPWESYPAKVQSLSSPYISLGRFQVITVETGYVARTINKGHLEMLEEGQHLLDDVSHRFTKFESIKQETKPLTKVNAVTQDNVGISISADVRYRITDPRIAFSRVDDVDQSILEIAAMQLPLVIGNHKLSDLIPAAGGLNFDQVDNVEAIEHIKDNQQGFSLIVQELMTSIGTMLTDLGITLLSIGIKNWEINDLSLAHELGQGAVIHSQTASKLATARNNAEILKINTESKANAIRTIATATKDAADLLADSPQAMELARLDKQAKIVGAAKNTTLFFGASGNPTFFGATPLPELEKANAETELLAL